MTFYAHQKNLLLFPYKELLVFYNRGGECLLRGTKYILKHKWG
jgi:hypothetical protein